MTFKERLKKEHPDRVDNAVEGGCYDCPHAYGYETWAESHENCTDTPYGKGCTYCWDREIPGTEKEEVAEVATDSDEELMKFIKGATEDTLYDELKRALEEMTGTTEYVKLVIEELKRRTE